MMSLLVSKSEINGFSYEFSILLCVFLNYDVFILINTYIVAVYLTEGRIRNETGITYGSNAKYGVTS